MVDGLSADGLIPCQNLGAPSLFSQMPTFGGSYTETAASTAHTWSIPVPGSRMDLTLWIDQVSAELEKTDRAVSVLVLLLQQSGVGWKRGSEANAVEGWSRGGRRGMAKQK